MTAALIPVKSLRDSKSRLAAMLTSDQRHELTLAMLDDVLAASLDAGLWPIVVVSRDPDVLTTAVAAGARGLVEPDTVEGLNEAVAYGLSVIERHGADHVLVILPDVPTIRASDLRLAHEWIDQANVVVIPAEDGGTNVLGLHLPAAIAPSFGSESARRHCQAATLAEVDLRVDTLPSLRWDIDTPDAIERYLDDGPRNRTHAALSSFGCLVPA